MNALRSETFDVVVVGGGISGLAAALSAKEAGAARVVLLEKASRPERGGNTRFSDAQMRFPHEADEYGSRSYSQEEFRDDLMRLSRGRANTELVGVLVEQAAETVEWLSSLGVSWEVGWPHTAGYRRRPSGGGQGLVNTLYARGEEAGVEVRYETSALELMLDGSESLRSSFESLRMSGKGRRAGIAGSGRVSGVRAQQTSEQENKQTNERRDRTSEQANKQTSETAGALVEFESSQGVVLASGGFQANVAMRVAHLGRFADGLILRGSRHDTGDGIRMALAIGAQAAGQWGDYHSAVIDARSPKTECGVTGLYNFQMGIIVDEQGQRFLDEGEDFRDNTYVKFSKAIIEEAAGTAFCIFDQQMCRRPEFQRAWYPVAPPIAADTIGELASALGIPPESLERTVREFNASVQAGELDLDRLDGKGTQGISPAKSNWAMPLEEPPFVAVPVTGGITFTFGGLKVDSRARVLDTAGRAIEGLYAAGELVGELYYYNYPGATSVLRGAVFGRIAGREARQRIGMG